MTIERFVLIECKNQCIKEPAVFESLDEAQDEMKKRYEECTSSGCGENDYIKDLYACVKGDCDSTDWRIEEIEIVLSQSEMQVTYQEEVDAWDLTSIRNRLEESFISNQENIDDLLDEMVSRKQKLEEYGCDEAYAITNGIKDILAIHSIEEEEALA